MTAGTGDMPAQYGPALIINEGDPLARMSVALQSRAPLIARLIASKPVIALRGLMKPRDLGTLLLADGRTLSEWIATTSQSRDAASAHVRCHGRGRRCTARRPAPGGPTRRRRAGLGQTCRPA